MALCLLSCDILDYFVRLISDLLWYKQIQTFSVSKKDPATVRPNIITMMVGALDSRNQDDL